MRHKAISFRVKKNQILILFFLIFLGIPKTTNGFFKDNCSLIS